MQLPFIVEPESNVEISSIGVKRFRSLLRKKSHHPEFQFFGLVSCNNTTATKPKKRNKDFRLSSLLEKYERVFRKELPDGLPPKRTVDHEIVTDPNANPPLRPLSRFLSGAAFDVPEGCFSGPNVFCGQLHESGGLEG